MADFLLDTNVILDYGVNLDEIVSSDDRLFITDVVLKELDGFKKSDDENIRYQVREIFRHLSPADSVDFKPKRGDIAAGFDFGKYHLISISREKYRVSDRADYDAKIIEIAKDYDLALLTADKAMTIRAHGEGVKFELLTGEKQAQANIDEDFNFNEQLEFGEVDQETNFGENNDVNLEALIVGGLALAGGLAYGAYKLWDWGNNSDNKFSSGPDF